SCVFTNLIWYVTQLQTLTSAATKKGGQSSGDVGAVYKYKNVLLDVKFDTQSTIATTLTFTEIAGYESSSSKLKKYTAGISVNKPDSSASIVLGDRGDTLRASYIHHFDLSKKTAA
nr:mitochondrial outer membrane protein porin 2-like [Tanacetum cinerariifolium]